MRVRISTDLGGQFRSGCDPRRGVVDRGARPEVRAASAEAAALCGVRPGYLWSAGGGRSVLTGPVTGAGAGVDPRCAVSRKRVGTAPAALTEPGPGSSAGSLVDRHRPRHPEAPPARTVRDDY